MKKILIVHHVSNLGGGTKSLLDMAMMLNEKNDVTICIPQGSSEIIEIAEKNNIKWYETKTPIPSFNLYSGMPSITSRYFLSRLFRFRKNKKLVQELLTLHPDAIFYNTVVTSLIAKSVPKSVKNICIVRETFLNSSFNKIYKKNFEENFAGVAYIANHEKEYLSLKNVREVVIPDCLEPKAIQYYPQEEMKIKYGIGNEQFSILFMGGTSTIKGLDVLLDAIDMLDDVVAIVSGTIDNHIFKLTHLLKHFYRLNYVRFIFKMKYKLPRLVKQGKIKTVGFVNDIAPYMCLADTVVFPSTAVHQPRPCIEAGIFRKSVILSDYEATSEYFIDSYNALTFTPKNSRDLANKINYLKEHPNENQLLGQNNQLMSEKLHNYEKTQEKLRTFFEEILEEV